MSSTTEQPKANLEFRRFREGDTHWKRWQDKIFDADHSHKCPTYIQATPPCQGSCPAGEDIRGYLNIVRGIEKPPRRRRPAGHELAGICLPPPHRREPVSLGDGAGVPGTVRVRLQPQPGRGFRRHQLGRAFPRRYRHRQKLRLRQAGHSHGQEGCGDRRRTRRAIGGLSTAAQGARGHHFRRACGARRHDALRHSGLSHAAQ